MDIYVKFCCRHCQEKYLYAERKYEWNKIKIREVSQSHQNAAAGHIIMSSSAHCGTFLLDIILCIIQASWTKNGILQITHSNLKVISCLPFWFDALSYLKFKEFLRTFLLWLERQIWMLTLSQKFIYYIYNFSFMEAFKK